MRTDDFINYFQQSPAVPYAVRSGNLTGSGVDLLNTDGQAVLFLQGTLSAVASVSFEESDDNGVTDSWTAVTSPATAYGGGVAISNQPPLALGINATETVYGVHFLRSKRYVRVVITGTGHSLSGFIMANAKHTPR